MKPESAERELRAIISEWAFEFSGDPGRSIADGEALIAALKSPLQEGGRTQELEDAIRCANDWLHAGEGVSLLYYFEDYGNEESMKAKAVIEEVLKQSETQVPSRSDS